MRELHAFAILEEYIDNASNATAKLGELSTYGATFAREVETYIDESVSANKHLMVFHNTGTSTNPLPLYAYPENYKLALDVTEKIVQASKAGQITEDGSSVYAWLIANYTSSNMAFPQIGTMVHNGVIWLPSYISWTDAKLDENQAVIDQTQIFLWFADGAFRGGHYEYDFATLPPIDNLDLFIEDPATAKTLAQSRSREEEAVLLEDLRNDCPETYRGCPMYMCYYPGDSNLNYPTNWYFLAWGIRGADSSVYREELRQFILANSKYPADEWENIFPDLFGQEEMRISPQWDDYAIPNETLTAGLYSPVIKPALIAELMRKALPGQDTHIDAYMYSLPSMYKSLTAAICSHPDNDADAYDFHVMYPAYILASSTSPDFGRIPQSTRDWIVKYQTALVHAETMTHITVVPPGHSRTIRDGIIFCSFEDSGVFYHIAAKIGYAVDDETTWVPPAEVVKWCRLNGRWIDVNDWTPAP